MTFQKITDNVFNCFILKEELKALNIDPRNASSDKNRIMEMVVQEAIEKGIIIKKDGPICMQAHVEINPLGMVLQCQVTEEIPEGFEDVASKFNKQMLPDVVEEPLDETVKENTDQDDDVIEGEDIRTFLFEFNTFHDTTRFCRQIIKTKPFEGSVYKLEHKYFVVARIEYDEATAVNIIEQAVPFTMNPLRIAYIQEHGKMLADRNISAIAEL